MLDELLRDEGFREELAKHSYYRERLEESVVDAERTGADESVEYFAISWESLSDFAKRPYRTAVATTCDEIVTLSALV